MNIEPTEGPWMVDNKYRATFVEGCAINISGRNWRCFAKVVTKMDGAETPDPEGLANVRLITAAPDGLKLARDVLLWAKTSQNHGGNPYRNPIVQQAERLVAKVEARPISDWAEGGF